MLSISHPVQDSYDAVICTVCPDAVSDVVSFHHPVVAQHSLERLAGRVSECNLIWAYWQSLVFVNTSGFQGTRASEGCADQVVTEADRLYPSCSEH
jgi:hypothetical protein